MTTLLAVDDSNTMRKVIELTFAGEHLKTVLAATAEDAIDKLFQAPADVALVDAGLGGVGGYELCRRIKTEFPNVQVLMLTSKQNPLDPARAAAVGATGHVDKPFDTQMIIDRVLKLAAEAAVPVLEPEEALPLLQPEFGESQPPAPRPESRRPVLELEPPMLEPDGDLLEPEPPPWQADTSQEDEVEEIDATTIPPSRGGAARVAATAAGNGSSVLDAAGMQQRLQGLGLTADQIAGVLALSREVVEQAVWEVVPALAETLIREEIARLTK